MGSILQVTTPYEVLTISEVIEGFKSGNATEVRYLEFEFYNRFAPYIYKVVIETCRHERDIEDTAKEILQLTFTKALEKIKSFKFPENAHTEEHKTNCLKAWLGKIANRKFLNILAKRQNNQIDIELVDFSIFSSEIADVDSQEVVTRNENSLKLREALDTLSEDERLIILTYANEGCVNSTRHLSVTAINFLCTTLQTNTVAIRKRKQRILERINSILFPS